jgi:hypothetical protein
MADRPILSAIADITLYSNFGSTFFSVPQSILRALAVQGDGDLEPLYIVLRDHFGNLIHQRRVQLVSGPEVSTSDFAAQIEAGQLYPGQRIRLEASLP